MNTEVVRVGDERAPSRRDWMGLAVLSIGLGLIVLDGTIVGVALPDIIGDLGLEFAEAQWVNSLYAVVLAALLLSSGKLADAFGRKRLFIAGLLVFIGGSVLAAMASGAALLIAARAVQALGAAMIMPSTLSTVNAVFRGRYRAAAFGVWGAVISGAAAVGPLAGGALTQWASWHWSFLVNVPIGAVVIAGALATVPETRGVRSQPGADVDGALLSAIGFGMLVFAVIEGPDLGWWSPKEGFNFFGLEWSADALVSPVPVALAIAVTALLLFVRWEIHRDRVRRSALLDVSLFDLRTFSWGNITAGMVAVGEFAIIFVLPLYLVNALGLSFIASGVVLAAMAIGAFFSGAMARHLAARVGSPGTVILGLSLELAGVVGLVILVGVSVSAWVIALPLIVYGLGLGLASAQLTGTVLQDVPVETSGQASATQSTVRQTLGTAFAGAAMSVTLAYSLPSALASAGFSGASADQYAEATRQSAGSAIEALREQGSSSVFGAQADDVVHALSAGMGQATQIALLCAAAFLVLGLVGAVQVKRASEASSAESS